MKFFYFIVIFPLSLAVIGQPLNNLSFSSVNTAYDELNPILAPDGRTLFITIANHPGNSGGKKDPGDIWFCERTSTNQWSTPVHAGLLLNNRAFNAIAGFSADGSEMYLLSHYDASGNLPRTQGIAVSRKTTIGWSRPENISIPYFQNKSSALYGSILPDRSAIVFSAETYGTRGVDDLYVSVKNSDGKWSEPKNLGSTINTQFQELSPSLTADGKTLYFSSNGRKGLGSFDVYTATRLDDTWTNWSEPLNMGSAVNTEGRDLFYRFYADQDFSLYTSTKNSDGYGDIKFYRKDDAVTPRDSVVLTTTTVTEPIQAEATDNRISVYGKVTNAKTGEAINARVYFSGPSHQDIAPATAAGYTIKIPSTDEYTVKIEANGYVSSLEKLDVHTHEMNVLEMNFRLQPVELGTTVNLKNVLFEQGKTVLLPQSYPELDLIVSFLQANPAVRIELAGHTDNRGIPAQNVKLSQARVDKVKSYLVSRGIDRKRLAGKGYGGSKPIASNDSEETRQLNRRVEFTIKKF
jgi:OOP family OmpA-OmpF porin